MDAEGGGVSLIGPEARSRDKGKETRDMEDKREVRPTSTVYRSPKDTITPAAKKVHRIRSQSVSNRLIST